MKTRKPPLMLQSLLGEHISFAAKRALRLATSSNRRVRIEFNGFKMLVSKRMSVRHIERLYQHSLRCEVTRYIKRQTVVINQAVKKLKATALEIIAYTEAVKVKMREKRATVIDTESNDDTL